MENKNRKKSKWILVSNGHIQNGKLKFTDRQLHLVLHAKKRRTRKKWLNAIKKSLHKKI